MAQFQSHRVASRVETAPLLPRCWHRIWRRALSERRAGAGRCCPDRPKPKLTWRSSQFPIPCENEIKAT